MKIKSKTYTEGIYNILTVTVNEGVKKKKKTFVLTVSDSVDFINEALVGELRCQRGEQVDVTVQEKQSVEHRQDLILTAGKLPLHPQHHVGYVLKTSRVLLFFKSNQLTHLAAVEPLWTSDQQHQNKMILPPPPPPPPTTLTRAHSPFPYICGMVPYRACKVMRPLAV